jgi:TolB-like protein
MKKSRAGALDYSLSERRARWSGVRNLGPRTRAKWCYIFEHHGSKRMNEFLADLTGRRLGTAAIVLCVALSSAAAQTPGAPASPPPTIAVLPLENNSGDPTQDFFASGMTDEIAAALTSVHGLDVVARSSSFRLPPASRDLKLIGQTLNASYLVQGSARMAEGRLRMNVGLVQARDGVALWSKDYDAERANVFDLEEDIAGKIAAALKLPVPAGEPLVRSRTRDLDAYMDFLRAKVAARERGAKALADAAVLLERVVMRDPCGAACRRRSARSSSARYREAMRWRAVPRSSIRRTPTDSWRSATPTWCSERWWRPRTPSVRR